MVFFPFPLVVLMSLAVPAICVLALLAVVASTAVAVRYRLLEDELRAETEKRRFCALHDRAAPALTVFRECGVGRFDWDTGERIMWDAAQAAMYGIPSPDPWATYEGTYAEWVALLAGGTDELERIQERVADAISRGARYEDLIDYNIHGARKRILHVGVPYRTHDGRDAIRGISVVLAEKTLAPSSNDDLLTDILDRLQRMSKRAEGAAQRALK
jgi:hypothetical protein